MLECSALCFCVFSLCVCLFVCLSVCFFVVCFCFVVFFVPNRVLRSAFARPLALRSRSTHIPDSEKDASYLPHLEKSIGCAASAAGCPSPDCYVEVTHDDMMTVLT